MDSEDEFYDDHNWNPNLKDFPPYNITDPSEIPYMGPSIDNPTKKKNPSGPFSFGLKIRGEIDRSKLPSRCLGSEGFELCADEMAYHVDWTFHYRRLNARNRCLSNIDYLKSQRGFRTVDLSYNRLDSALALSGLQFIKILNLENNMICYPSQIPAFPSLHAMNLASNLFTTAKGFRCQPSLHYLNLANNQLTCVDGLNSQIFPSLKTLELRGNKITSLQKLSLPVLQHLYVAENQLTSVADIVGVPNIISFHARNNKIESLQGFPVMLEKLMYMNLRGNLISKHTDLLVLGHSPLRALVLMQCPISGRGRYRLESITSIICLVRLDKEMVKQTEVSAAMYLRKQRSLGNIPPLNEEWETQAPPPTPNSGYNEAERRQIKKLERTGLIFISPREDTLAEIEEEADGSIFVNEIKNNDQDLEKLMRPSCFNCGTRF